MRFAVGKEYLLLAINFVRTYKEERDVVFPGNAAESREINICFDVRVPFWSTAAISVRQPF